MAAVARRCTTTRSDSRRRLARPAAHCDAYVDGKLAEFSELLATTLRTVDSGRNHLRSPSTGHGGGRSTLYDYQV